MPFTAEVTATPLADSSRDNYNYRDNYCCNSRICYNRYSSNTMRSTSREARYWLEK